MSRFDINKANEYIHKWQEILRLRDWDIKLYEVKQEWRKTGDIKIDENDRKAIVMLNNFNPKQDNLEALMIHELLHLKLWGMDQMIEELIEKVFGSDIDDKKYEFAYKKFMEVLEPTVEDLAKGYLSLGGDKKEISFGRVQKQVDKELGL
ncbi:hypothetical protein SH1V18_16620 [Vallitalea longa]|uniref:Uncharacterized protein n=1 Tax=Vallitalea longa TaxID=2936439 RepID=A0A9W5Y8K4_9FIRM|nr:hypothetical protein [Vallitalea longa]GKX29182.1 hypothetical protein SH1V18_16620 [Vallitalea longa]